VIFKAFILGNARWLGGGLNLTFFSSFGQTFFIALYAGQIRDSFDLTHGEFGSVYMVGTLCSAITLVFIGKIVDYVSVRQVSAAVIVAYSVACIAMATAQSAVALAFAIFLLRLCGQGMMSHIAMTAMGRWFVSTRGKAVSLTGAGHQLGEGVLPWMVIPLLAILDYRTLWWFCAAALLIVALPLTLTLFGKDRSPHGESEEEPETGRQWTRREALGDIWFWLICIGILAPGFIGTSIWFHQVHLLETKNWAPASIVTGFTLMSITTVCMSLLAGMLVDRFSAYRLLPFILIPLASAAFLLSLAVQQPLLLLVMFFMGLSQGLYSAVFGAVLSEVYGTRHLGAVRSVVFAGMVFSSAVGPGITGWLIDRGVGFDTQLLFMGGFCLFAVLLQIPVVRTVHARLLSDGARYGRAMS